MTQPPPSSLVGNHNIHNNYNNNENESPMSSWGVETGGKVTTVIGRRPSSSSSQAALLLLAWLQEHEMGILLFLIGVWNNAPYVTMLASAKDVAEGGVALVYIANVLPGKYERIASKPRSF